MAEKTELLPAYLPFALFKYAVQNLRAHGLPSHLDRTAWDSRSGGDQALILGAFRFLGLIGENDEPTEALKRLYQAQENSDEEKQEIGLILRDKYAKVFSGLDLSNATPKQLDDAIGEFNISGRTKERAVRFFLKAASYSRVPLSTRLTKRMRERTGSADAPVGTEGGNGDKESTSKPNGTNRTSRKRRKAAPPNPPAPAQAESGNGPAGGLKTIRLPKVGGSLTISGTFNSMQLVGEERKLVFDIVDLMVAFEEKNGTGDQ